MKHKSLIAQTDTRMKITEMMRLTNPQMKEGDGPLFHVKVYQSLTGKSLRVEIRINERVTFSRNYRDKYKLRHINEDLHKYNLKLKYSTSQDVYDLHPNIYCPYNAVADRIDALAHSAFSDLPKRNAQELENVLNNIAYDLRAEGRIPEPKEST